MTPILQDMTPSHRLMLNTSVHRKIESIASELDDVTSNGYTFNRSTAMFELAYKYLSPNERTYVGSDSQVTTEEFLILCYLYPEVLDTAIAAVADNIKTGTDYL